MFFFLKMRNVFNLALILVISSVHSHLLSINKDYNENIGSTIDLINYCFPNSRSIGIISNTTNFKIFTAFENSPKAFALYDYSLNSSKADKLQKLSLKHPIDLYVTIISRPESLLTNIKRLKNTVKWRNDKFFIIIASAFNSTSNSSCNSARSFMHSALSANILNMTFICKDEDNNTLLFTANMFNSYLPYSWKATDKLKLFGTQKSGTVFKQNYGLNPTVCTSLVYDKTQNCSRQRIYIAGVNYKPFVWYSLDNRNESRGVEVTLFNTMLTYLNAESYLRIAQYNLAEVCKRNEDGEIRDVTGEFDYDFVMNSKYTDPTVKGQYTYPLIWTRILAVTRRRRNMTSLERILSFMPPHIIAILFATGEITYIIMKYVFDDWELDSISTIQIVLNQSVPQQPISNPARIFFSTIVLLFLVTSSVFQGNLATLLTIPLEQKNVDKVSDLDELGFAMMAESVIHQQLLDSFHGNITYLYGKSYLCSWLKYNQVYVDEEYRILCTSPRKICHVSREHFFTIYKWFTIRPFWPLRRRVNDFLFRVFEAGVIEKMSEDSISEHLIEIDGYWDPPEQPNRKVKIEDLLFAFLLLAIGLITSFIVFLIELCIFIKINLTMTKKFQ